MLHSHKMEHKFKRLGYIEKMLCKQHTGMSFILYLCCTMNTLHECKGMTSFLPRSHIIMADRRTNQNNVSEAGSKLEFGKYSTSFCWRGWSGGGPPDILAFSQEVQLSNHYQKEQPVVQTQNLQDSWDSMEGRHSQE